MITESRVKNGTLTFGGEGGTSFACQATNVHLTPNYADDGDEVETLCGDKIPAGKKESWVIGGSSIQDFDDPDGFVRYCRDHAMETVAFEWLPNTDGAENVEGNVVILAVEYGGDVNSRLSTDWEFDVSGSLTWTPSASTTLPTTATAGTPGAWSGKKPTSLAEANGAPADYLAEPDAAWTTGQYVNLADGSTPIHYDGAAFVAGIAA